MHGEPLLERAVEDRVARRVDEVREQYRVLLRQPLRAPAGQEEEYGRGRGRERDNRGERGRLVPLDSGDDVLRAQGRARVRFGVRGRVRRGVRGVAQRAGLARERAEFERACAPELGVELQLSPEVLEVYEQVFRRLVP